MKSVAYIELTSSVNMSQSIPWLIKTFYLHFLEKKSGIAIQALY